jgi:type I site-specific restriction-modification system R (restriction) subunit
MIVSCQILSGIRFKHKLTKGKSIDRARLLREQLIIERDGQPALRLKLADQRNWENNSFQVLNQFQNQRTETSRIDTM